MLGLLISLNKLLFISNYATGTGIFQASARTVCNGSAIGSVIFIFLNLIRRSSFSLSLCPIVKLTTHRNVIFGPSSYFPSRADHVMTSCVTFVAMPIAVTFR